MEYVVTAFDGSDSDALERRLNARDAHLEGIKRLKELGHFISGGAILDDDGKMIGSTVHVEFNNREDLDQWMNNDPYVLQKVWLEIDVRPIRLVLRD